MYLFTNVYNSHRGLPSFLSDEMKRRFCLGEQGAVGVIGLRVLGEGVQSATLKMGGWNAANFRAVEIIGHRLRREEGAY